MSKLGSFLHTDRFEVRAELGHGAMGTVYRVYDREIGREVALKTMQRPGPAEVLRLKSEFRALAGITHPNLLQLHELFVDHDICFFTMELIEGKDFSRWIRGDLAIPRGAGVAFSTGPPSDSVAELFAPTLGGPGEDPEATLGREAEEPAVRASRAQVKDAPPDAWTASVSVPGETWTRLRRGFAELVRGLDALHASGRVHRDVKPANVLVSNGDRVTLLDFGLVTQLGGSGDKDGTYAIVGTPAYMAPEQVRKDLITRAADFYAVGAMLYEAITGVLPFDGLPRDILERKARFAPRRAHALAPSVPMDLADLAMDLLNAHPAKRPSAQACLEHLATGQGSAAAFEMQLTPPNKNPFVGRVAELDMLTRALDDVIDGRKQITVHVHGPSGIGKSTLVREFFAMQKRATDLLVLEGRCHPAESVPYRALDAAIDDLARHLDTLPADAVQALVPERSYALRKLFPVLDKFAAFRNAPVPAPLPDAVELRQHGSAALRELCAALCQKRTFVLWLDDVQWGDLDSAPLLDAMLATRDDAGGSAAPPFLLLLTYRSDERERSPLLRHLFPKNPKTNAGETVRVIELGALGVGDITVLARSILQQLATDERGRIDAVVAQSGGNPFIAGEIARYASLHDVPHTHVGDLVLERVRALDADQRKLVEVAAIAGRPLERSIALAAAGLDEGARPMVARLRDALLLREVASDGGTAVAAYHDRVREALLQAMPEALLADRHRSLAEALEARRASDHEALAYHWEGAGERRKAGNHARHAAERASAALAFDHAAALYAKCLDLWGEAANRAELLEKLGDTLANLGRAPEAAKHYLDAAERLGRSCDQTLPNPQAPADRSGALRRRAAEQYLKGGFIDDGWREMRVALEALRVRIPGSSAVAIGAASWRRLVFLLRRFGTPRRTFPGVLPATERPLVDALWMASTSMSMVNPHLADAFRMAHLLRVLDVGDASTVCRALAYEASMETHLGGVFLDRSVEAILDEVALLAKNTGDPYDEAWQALAIANVAFTRGEWRRTAETCRRADAIFREKCPGTAWERVTVAIFHHFALAWLGELGVLAPRLVEFASEARRHGDIHALCEAYVGEPMLAWLAVGRGEEARANAAEALARQVPRSRTWPEKGYRRQQYAAMIASNYASHYAGDPWPAWQLLREHWPDLEASFLLPLRTTGLELRWARARAALAAAATMSHDHHRPPAGICDARWTRRALIDDVKAQVRVIEKDPLALGRPVGHMLRASVAYIEGRFAESMGALKMAIAGFDWLEMALHREAARLALGDMMGSTGEAQIQRAEAWMAGQGIVQPRAMTAALAPGMSVGPEGGRDASRSR